MRKRLIGLMSLMLAVFVGACWAVGENCSTPIVVTIPANLPYYDNYQTTCGKGDDYRGGSLCLYWVYTVGEDIIYQLNVTTAIVLNISVTAPSYSSIGMALDQGCPPSYVCIDTVYGESGPWTFSNVNLSQGTYYLMIDKAGTPPTCIPWFNLSITTPNPPPPNETCAGAIHVVPNLPYSYSGNLGYFNDCSEGPYFDVFFNVTIPVTGLYNFNMCNSYSDTWMKVYTDGICCSENYVYGNDECGNADPSINVNLTAGQTVFVECGTLSYSYGACYAYNFNITPPPPQNETCAGSISPRTFPYSYSGNLGVSDDCPGGPTYDVFFNVTASENGLFNFNMCNSNGDTYMLVHTDGICCSEYVQMVHGGCSGDDPSIDLNLTAGQIVYLQCGYYNPTGGAWSPYNFNVSYVPSPDYYWRNNCGEGTANLHDPSFHWESVTSNQLPCATSYDPQDGYLGDDDWEGPFPLGFTFNYYNEPYTQFTICSNGFIMLGDTGDTQYMTDCIPYMTSPNNMLAWFWDDMNPRFSPPTTVYWGNAYVDGVYALVVTFNNVPRYGEYNEFITAQAILKDNGNIKYQYNTITPGFYAGESVIGIENRTGMVGVQYWCWGEGGYCFQDSLAIEFGTNPGPLPTVHVTAERQGSDIVLRWENIPFVPQYRIYRGTDPDFTPSGTPHAIVSINTWTDPLVIDSAGRYFYIVTTTDETTMR